MTTHDSENSPVTQDQFEELDSLLIDWEDGSLDNAGVERVREILRADEAARAYYARLQMLNAAMKFEDDAGLAGADVSMAGPTLAPRWRPQRWMLAVAAMLIVALAGRLIQLELTRRDDIVQHSDGASDSRDKSEELTSHGVALLTRLVDVEWGADQKPLEVGDALPPGRLALASGFAQVEFFCGATVVLEGPAELDLQTPMLARVRSGRLRALVPPAARGFTLKVDELDVIDLGTEFGLSVLDEGAIVQVFDGEVALQHDTKGVLRLEEGPAKFWAPDRILQPAEATLDSFPDIAALESRAQDQRDERYERWRAWSAELRRDERLIAYYAFDQEGGWNRRLNSSLQPTNAELDGAIVGAHRVPGRWPSKSGLEFKGPGDRVRVQIPGKFESLTFACWVKIDSLDRWYNSLFLTDNYNQGEPHWQILDSGQLYFSVRPKERNEPGPRDFKSLSPVFWNPTLSGRWIHLAVVYDVDNQSISHFLNGRLLSRDDVPAEQIVATRIGAASIGNWSLPTQPDSEFAIRNLNGSIDEFAIFASALAAEEIKEIYEHGKP